MAGPSVPPIVLDGHQNEPLAVAFAPDGQHIISTGADGTVHLWDCQACGPMSEAESVARSRLPQ